ncbi:MAG: four-carbon acid sugar kinase family protein [Marinilabiliaceae bacterium]|nr:four-carbon acid sugar kinase family protein [Marinilabiliaceae bacterium]
MIAVIADDFTGAAEIGGIGIRHGLKVAIETDVVEHDDLDLLVIATDTRSMCAMDASKTIKTITAKLMLLQPDYIYKKLDSVLRGNVYAELVAQMEVMKLKKSVVVAANPIFKRTISNGEYFIDGEPLHHTHFSIDPDYPVASASVKDIIGFGQIPLITGAKAMDVLPREGIVVADVVDLDDLTNWCIQIDEKTMPAGASGFFNSFLQSKIDVKPQELDEDVVFNEKALFVFGSSYPKDIDFEEKLKSKDILLSHMPEEIYFNKNYDTLWFDKWVDTIVDGILQYNKVVLAVPYRTSAEENIGQRIKKCFAQIIIDVMKRVEINELLIEGGSTTSTILNLMGVKKLIPVQEFEVGIIRMAVAEYPNLFLTTKPGSYSWPEIVWQNDVHVEKLK